MVSEKELLLLLDVVLDFSTKISSLAKVLLVRTSCLSLFWMSGKKCKYGRVSVTFYFSSTVVFVKFNYHVYKNNSFHL